MAGDPDAKNFLNRNFIDRFVSIGDSDYDDIRRMCRAAESAGFESI
jgi:hypothetical protein